MTKVANHLALSTHLTRIQFDDHRFVDIASDISTVGNLFERSGQLGGIDVHPLRHALASGQIQRFADAKLGYASNAPARKEGADKSASR